jgi:DNA-directed RNA polymerase specialized sigma24 family protein
MDAFAGDEPTPVFLAQMTEEVERLLEKLGDDTLRNVARWKMDGLENEEIAQKLGRTERSVRRKLELIRVEWEAVMREGD